MLRKVIVLTVALLAVTAAAAQAHTATATVACGSVTLDWLDFAATGNGGGGLNSPTYSVAFTPAGASAPTFTVTDHVSFPGPALLKTITLPATDGTVVASSSWTAATTRDGTNGEVAGTFVVSDCPPPSTTTTTTTTTPTTTTTTTTTPTTTTTTTPTTTTTTTPTTTTTTTTPTTTTTTTPTTTTTTTTTTPAAPSFTLRKLEADPSSPSFGAGPITANVGDTIRYEIIVTNTGNEPLNLTLVDTLCTGISGPTGNVTGNTLAVGGTATWTCSHLVVAADFPTYVNVAQVTGTPPGGTPLPPQRSSVVANVPTGGVAAVCVASALKIRQSTSRSGQTVNAIVSGVGLKRVVFALDGRAVKTLLAPNLSGGRYEYSIKLSSTRYGTHSLTAKATNACGKASGDGITFAHNVPVKRVVPRFTG